ncbi:AlpA family phage regulatory protein [Ancylobacter sonchi]|uniref:helix-turn-helix transcriptional regulator n=1 Tax=Ancylobacter sonchi TaxID=1937790 RepID=UPI001BD231D2|nr:AlpA family phage regulatory protein [Ancylobacter sonchi]MBS7534260.1 AlpA family phage regulatory protein [Ancylobacter sonchi]
MPANDNRARLMSVNDVVREIGLSRAELFKRRAAGTFPAAVPLGDRRIAFIRTEVDAWIDARIAARDLRSAA